MNLQKLALSAMLSLCPFFAQATSAAANATTPSPKASAAKSARAPASLTRADLLKGSKIPEKREFPINPDISPCENFYEHVCSKVRDTFQLPENRSRWMFSANDAAERLLDAKKNFFRALEKGYVPGTERAKQTRDYYKACMNAPARTKEEITRLHREKNLILGLKSADELADLAQHRIDQPGETFLGVFDIANQADPSRNDAALMASWTTLPERSYYHKDDVMKDFEALVTSLFENAGIDKAAQRAKWVVEFEKAFADANPLPAERRDRFSEDRYFSVPQWLTEYPHLKLERILTKIPEKIKIRRPIPEGFDFMEKALTNRPLEELKSVYLFHSLNSFMDDAYPNYYAKKFEFSRKHFGGAPKRPDRQERCTKETMRAFSKEIDEELITTLFPNFPEKKIEEIVNKVRASLLKELEQNKWLSNQARKEAQRKIAQAHMFLVKPKREEDWGFNLLARYNPKTPLANQELLAMKQTEKMFNELPEPRNRNEWSMSPLELNAYYSPSDNKFVMLQGMLQPPFFDSAKSDLENIAAIGSTVGHELGHSIDDQGSKYDADGKLQSWMTEADKKEFHRRGEAMVKLFDGIGHNGKLTLGENIGDLVGLLSSYAAAFPEPKKATIEDERKFFYAFAVPECYKSRPGVDEQQIKTDPHSLGFARINQQVMQSSAFARAFSCKAGDKMVIPEKDQIRIW